MFHAEHNGSTGNSFAAGALNRDGYMFSVNTPLRPFGYGLSYTSFSYEGFRLSIAPDGRGDARVTVRNTGAMDGEEVTLSFTQATKPVVITGSDSTGEVTDFRYLLMPRRLLG